MTKQIAISVKAHLVRGAAYLLLLSAGCAIPFALGQRQPRAPSPYANTITVINTRTTAAPGSLRQAILDANDGHMINFDAALKGETVTLTTAELVINKKHYY